MEYIIISPHCDDAILSCWYFLRHEDALIITIFGDSQFSFNLNYTNSMSFRMIEELYFAIKTKKKLIYYHLPEILKLNHLGIGTKKYNYCYKKRTETLKNLSKKLLSGKKNACFLLPLGIGKHPDHTLVRDVFIESAIDFQNLIFYEDQFYRSINSEDDVKRAKNEIKFSLRSINHEINFAKKINTFIKYYPSQVQEKYVDAMKKFYRKNNIETYWITKNVNLELQNIVNSKLL